MMHNTINLDLSRPQKQQQKPAPKPSKAAIRKSGGKTSNWAEIPKGYVVRSGHTITAKTIRPVGPRDTEIVQLAVETFGYLLDMRAVVTLAGFASLIELRCKHPKARAVADTLHRLSA